MHQSVMKELTDVCQFLNLLLSFNFYKHANAMFLQMYEREGKLDYLNISDFSFYQMSLGHYINPGKVVIIFLKISITLLDSLSKLVLYFSKICMLKLNPQCDGIWR